MWRVGHGVLERLGPLTRAPRSVTCSFPVAAALLGLTLEVTRLPPTHTHPLLPLSFLHTEVQGGLSHHVAPSYPRPR